MMKQKSTHDLTKISNNHIISGWLYKQLNMIKQHYIFAGEQLSCGWHTFGSFAPHCSLLTTKLMHYLCVWYTNMVVVWLYIYMIYKYWYIYMIYIYKWCYIFIPLLYKKIPLFWGRCQNVAPVSAKNQGLSRGDRGAVPFEGPFEAPKFWGKSEITDLLGSM